MKTKTNKQNKVALNNESKTVLKVIVKNEGLGATAIRSKLKWKFIPPRALGLLKDGGWAKMADDKGYSVTASGRKALAKD